MKARICASILAVSGTFNAQTCAYPHSKRQLSSDPVRVKSLGPQFQPGYVVSSNSGSVRDKGYWGNIAGKDILVYKSILIAKGLSHGDTFGCPDVSVQNGAGTYEQQGTCTMDLRANSASLHPPTDKMLIQDFNTTATVNSVQWPGQFCDYVSEWGEQPTCNGLGMVNVVSGGSNPNQGYTYYKLEARGCTVEHNMCSGVAVVDVSDTVPTCKRSQQCFWTSEEALFPGGAGSINGNDGYIYQLASSGQPDWAVFLSRVPEDQAMTKSAYQCYHADTQSWTSTPITSSAPLSQAVMQDIADGQPIWSPYYQQFLYVGRSEGGLQNIEVRSAPSPMGPWSAQEGTDPGNHLVARAPATDGSYIYGIAPQPQFDQSRKTLTINYGPVTPPNTQRTLTIEFCQEGDADCVEGASM